MLLFKAIKMMKLLFNFFTRFFTNQKYLHIGIKIEYKNNPDLTRIRISLLFRFIGIISPLEQNNQLRIIQFCCYMYHKL